MASKEFATLYEPLPDAQWIYALRSLVIQALVARSAGNKQWFLEKIGERLGLDLDAYVISESSSPNIPANERSE